MTMNPTDTTTPTLATIDLTAGPLDYVDTGGPGRVIVLLPGLLMDASLYSAVVDGLRTDHRCIVPVLPLGAHRRPMRADADPSLPGVAGLVVELLDRLDLHDVVLVGNDTGGAVAQLVAVTDPSRLGALVLVSCDAFDNVPPGLTGRTIVALGRLAPSLFGLFMQQMRIKPVRRLPMSFGRLTRRGDAVVRGWLDPVLHDAAIRRDTVRCLRAIGADREVLTRITDRLGHIDRPALVVWAEDDRVMPPEHGERLSTLLDAPLVVVADSATLVPLDQPAALATAIRSFVGVRS